jgi:hypothetical protein
MRFGRLTLTLAVSYAIISYNSLIILLYLNRFLSTNPFPDLCFRLCGTQHCHGHVPSLNPASPTLDCQPQPKAKDSSHGSLFRRYIRHDSGNYPSCHDYEGTSHATIIYLHRNTRLLRAAYLTHTLQNSPDGAEAGSKWACRETFVSIVVSNLPIIQPLIRKGFRKIGLTHVFSSSGKTSGQPYQLSSRGLKSFTNRGEGDTKKSKTNTAAPTHMQTSAWGSDEHILAQNEPSSKDITVVSETVVQSEPWTFQEGSGVGSSTTPPKEWNSRLSQR